MIVVTEHRNQYYGRSRAYGPARFKEVNCRDFESRGGLVETRSSSCKKPVTKRAFSGSLSPKMRSPLTSLPVNTVKSFSEDKKKSRKPASPFNLKVDVGSRNDEFRFSELWAGPAYSNSPPPSSLPIPKFSLRPKRSVSFELPGSASDIDLRAIAKSAPASPTREPFSRNCIRQY
ncbi:hypothetical protein RND71_006949 [Anisodus tanguticus]|uniref:Uncharacterized protein n=1 Tax=Anisodus tanguticus TaxID=243964 RepID=A0AAE1SUE0_9SOLA|nr:hypothetical protein RND71_006949 [Anisodus tanguticus]